MFIDDDINVSEEVVDPQNNETLTDEPAAGASDNDVDNPEPQRRQSPDVDAAFARLRRENEELRRYRAQVEAERQRKEAENNTARMREIEQQYREQGWDIDAIRAIVRNDPEFQALKAKNEQYETMLRKQQEDQKLMNDYRELVAEFGDQIKKPEDIPPEVWRKYQKGYSLVDAYVSVSRKSLIAGAKESGAQKTLNTLQSKQHLRTEKDGADDDVGDVHIPEDTLQMYIDQGMTRAQALKYHKKLYG